MGSNRTREAGEHHQQEKRRNGLSTAREKVTCFGDPAEICSERERERAKERERESKRGAKRQNSDQREEMRKFLHEQKDVSQVLGRKSLHALSFLVIFLMMLSSNFSIHLLIIDSHCVLRRVCKRFKSIIVWFDNDEAGIKSAKLIVSHINSLFPGKAKAIHLEGEYKDPSDYLAKKGKEELLKFLKEKQLIK